MQPLAVVPGHRDVETNLMYVDRMISAFDEMTALAKCLVGVPPLSDEQAQASIDLSLFRAEFGEGVRRVAEGQEALRSLVVIRPNSRDIGALTPPPNRLHFPG